MNTCEYIGSPIDVRKPSMLSVSIFVCFCKSDSSTVAYEDGRERRREEGKGKRRGKRGGGKGKEEVKEGGRGKRSDVGR